MNVRKGVLTRGVWVPALAMLCMCMATRAQSDTWKTYSYPENGFSIGAPAEPQLSQQDVPTAAGKFTAYVYTVSVSNSSSLMVGMSDYGSAVNGRDPNSVLEGVMNGAVAKVKGHILQSSNIAIGSYPGKGFEAENDQYHMSCRIYLVGSLLYQLLVITPINQTYPDSGRFLDSFQLIPRSSN